MLCFSLNDLTSHLTSLPTFSGCIVNLQTSPLSIYGFSAILTSCSLNSAFPSPLSNPCCQRCRDPLGAETPGPRPWPPCACRVLTSVLSVRLEGYSPSVRRVVYSCRRPQILRIQLSAYFVPLRARGPGRSCFVLSDSPQSGSSVVLLAHLFPYSLKLLFRTFSSPPLSSLPFPAN